MNFFNLLFLGKYGNYHKTNWYEALFAKVVGAGRKLIAKFLKIKGNTIEWNQLVPSLSAMSGQNGTISVADNVATITATSSVGYIGISLSGSAILMPTSNHKYLMTADIKVSKTIGSVRMWYGDSLTLVDTSPYTVNTWSKKSEIVENGTPSGQYVQLRVYHSFEQGDTFQVKNWNIFDLTAMFGSGNEPSTVEEFTSLFPLPYYSYEQGKLLSFNGSGIKTVGKNLAQNDNATNQNRTFFNYTSETLQNVSATKNSSGGVFYLKLKVNLKANKSYKLSIGDVDVNESTRVNFYIYSDALWGNAIYVNKFVDQNSSHTFSFTENYENAVIGLFVSGNAGINIDVKDIMVTFADADTSSFEDHQEYTTNLPTLTYFPTGMKSAGSVYDELTNSKAITRVGSVDLGSLAWGYRDSGTAVAPYFYTNFDGIKYVGNFTTVKGNILCSKYQTVARNTTDFVDKTICIDGAEAFQTVTQVQIKDSSYTDAQTFKTSLNGVMLQYELAEEVVVDIDPPLELNYQVWNGGTEQLLPINTDNPTTSPILADIEYPDGERDNQYFTYRQYLPNSRMMSMALNTIMGKSVEFNQQALDILMKGE